MGALGHRASHAAVAPHRQGAEGRTAPDFHSHPDSKRRRRRAGSGRGIGSVWRFVIKVHGRRADIHWMAQRRLPILALLVAVLTGGGVAVAANRSATDGPVDLADAGVPPPTELVVTTSTVSTTTTSTVAATTSTVVGTGMSVRRSPAQPVWMRRQGALARLPSSRMPKPLVRPGNRRERR